jgi:hypothetical protein
VILKLQIFAIEKLVSRIESYDANGQRTLMNGENTDGYSPTHLLCLALDLSD